MSSATLRFDQREALISWNQVLVDAGEAGITVPSESSIPPHTTADLMRSLVMQATTLGVVGATINNIPAVVDDREFGELYDHINAMIVGISSLGLLQLDGKTLQLDGESLILS
jgi:hypothetical protein